MKSIRKQKGFTLPELMIVILMLFSVGGLISLFFVVGHFIHKFW